MSQHRNLSLDFIRAISLILIIFYHYNCAIAGFISEDMVVFNGYGFTSPIGVSLFFILSGASLMLSTQSNYSLINFYKKRFLAIFPLFWATYILFILVITVIFQLNPFLGRNPATFALTIIGLDGLLSYKIPNYYLIGEWFLGCIIILYILFPALRYLYLKNKFLLIAASFATCIILVNIYNLDMPLFFFPLYRVFEFVFGMYFMYVITIQSFNLSKIRHLIIAIVSFMGLFIIFLFGITKYLFVSTTVIGIISFIFLSSFSNLFVNYIPKQFIRFLSKYSYAAFLVHHQILNLVVSHPKIILILNTTQNRIVLFIALYLFIYLISYLIYNSVRYLLRNSFAVL